MNEVIAMEKTNIDILKLNIGNPAAFGFRTPNNVIKSIEKNLIEILTKYLKIIYNNSELLK